MAGGIVTRRPRRLTLLLPLLAAPAAVGLALAFGFDPVARLAADPLIHRNDGFTGSEACRSCHLEQHASWEKTFHRTMTQRADADTVVGAFDGREVAWQGRTGRPLRVGERFFMDVPGPGSQRRRAEVALAVGSRRYQQYFEEDASDGTVVYRRLPLVWHIEAQRWVHLGTIFLGPDDPDWDLHAARWNENCVLCHNTGPKPGLTDWRRHRYRSTVGELGIACEACHGPGAKHAGRYRGLLDRYWAYWDDDADPTIINPARLDAERAVDLCGQCHGQRVPNPRDNALVWLTAGPTFRSGQRLLDHAEPVVRDTASPRDDEPDVFRLRFWGDGTPRLTAYEYQGIVASACYLRGSMACQSCHTMHSGDPRGMIPVPKKGDEACLPCHQAIAADIAGHTHHRPESSGSRCLECHMPKIVYGITTIHRSHRIDNPDPAREAATGRPGACTLCHLDRTPSWAAEQVAALWKRPLRPVVSRSDRAPLDLPDAVASILAGDVVQRAVWSYAAGRAEAAPLPAGDAFLRAPLALTLGDGYPAVRWLAQRSLAGIESRQPRGIGDLLARYDHTGPVDDRTAIARAILGRSDVATPDALSLEAMIGLAELQGSQVIAIGE